MKSGLMDGDPQRLGGYWLAGRLGAGGRGVVYEAYDAEGRRVAVRVLPDDAGTDPELRGRFGREAAAARRVAPFCAAGVLDADLDGPRPYIVSEYVEGPTLRGAVAEGRRFTGGDLHRLATAVATALTAVHEAGIAHRDLKPDDVLLGPDGPRVIDFGVARTADLSPTATGMAAGIPTYLAPEIFTGRGAGTSADVFAWGGIMVFAATGADPFRVESVGGVTDRVLSVRPQLDMLPEHLRPFVAASLARDPEARPSARDLLLALVGGDGGLGTPELLAAGREAGAPLRAPVADPALGTLAEEVYAGLGPAERELAPEVFLRLVTVTDDGRLIVRRAWRAEFLDGRAESEAAAVRRLLRAFAPFLSHDDQEIWLSRPALPQAWPRLRMWVRANRDGLVVHRGILTAARRWQTQGRADGDLLRGGGLESATHWAATGRRAITLSLVERDFLKAGAALAGRRARRSRLLSVTLAVLLVIALAAGTLAVRQGMAADARSAVLASQRDSAEARRLATTADTLRVADPVRAMLLSVAAWRLAPVIEARASLSGSLAQWETATFHDPATSIRTLRALSGDGRTLVSAGEGEARIWDVRTGRRTGGFGGIGEDLRALALSPSGRLLAVINGLELTVWDVVTGGPTGVALTVRGRFDGGDTGVFFGQAENRLVVVRDRGLTVVDLTTGRTTSPPGFGSVDVSPDGNRLVAGGVDGLPTVWTLDRTAGLPLGGGCDGCAPDVAYSPDGRTVAVARNKDIELRDAFTGARLDPLFEEGDGGDLAFSPDGRFLSAADETSLKLWRVRDGRLLLTRRIDAFSPVVAFDPDGRTLRHLTEGSVTAFDITALTRPVTLKGPVTTWAELAPGGRLLASRETETSEVVLRDVRRRTRVAALEAGPVRDDGHLEMAFSGDGRRLAIQTGGRSPRLTVWDTVTFRRIAAVAIRRDARALAVAINTDGSAVASYANHQDARRPLPGRGKIRVWDVPSGRLRWSRPQESVAGQVFSPNGKALAPVGGDQRLLDTVTGKPFGDAYGSRGTGSPMISLAFSRDGARFATADRAGRISVWETATRRRVGVLIRGGAGAGAGLVHSPRGDVIAAGAGERAVALWDIATGRRLGQPITVGTGDLRSLAFAEDGSRLIMIDVDGVLTEHPVDPELAARAVCARAGRTLSREEWSAYLNGVPYRNVCPL
ncbi:WD40 repeat protein [Streptosporangium lutulentum]|uniref:WD40 repeat protein n=1 Tax=Streptosporangium lutulentum TaxID=1461250 RepID=A0ABT9Q2B9_9ACTN|nr:serine/threonine-protein kinase [Streptosporangium lutulentum]MDP9840882.1 WD40 repeat protein [Streptosporangium lutulentum]